MELVPFDGRDGWIWLDGALIPWRDAKLHVLTHGLHYASAVFEGERAYAGNIFRLRDHTDRLINSARILGFEIPYSADASTRRARELLAANGLTDAYVRPIAWRGARCWRWRHSETNDPSGDRRLAVAELLRRRPHGGHPAWGWRSGSGPSPETAPTASKATGLYMIGTLSKHKAEQDGYADALMLDWRGRVAESTGANIFFVMDGELHTPTPDGFLDGITRRSVMALARRQQMKVVERPIEFAEIGRATEVFLAGTAAEVTPVREIAGHCYTPRRITETLLGGYDALVRQPPAEVAKVVAG